MKNPNNDNMANIGGRPLKKYEKDDGDYNDEDNDDSDDNHDDGLSYADDSDDELVERDDDSDVDDDNVDDDWGGNDCAVSTKKKTWTTANTKKTKKNIGLTTKNGNRAVSRRKLTIHSRAKMTTEQQYQRQGRRHFFGINLMMINLKMPSTHS